jgi:hypothetical protein
MKGRKIVLGGLVLMAALTMYLLASFNLPARESVERIMTLILSTEILTPALILGLASVAYFFSKSQKWRSR